MARKVVTPFLRGMTIEIFATPRASVRPRPIVFHASPRWIWTRITCFLRAGWATTLTTVVSFAFTTTFFGFARTTDVTCTGTGSLACSARPGTPGTKIRHEPGSVTTGAKATVPSAPSGADAIGVHSFA